MQEERRELLVPELNEKCHTVIDVVSCHADSDLSLTSGFTADQLQLLQVAADGPSCELGKEGWNVALKHDAEQEYPQAVIAICLSPLILLGRVPLPSNVESSRSWQPMALKLGMTNASGWYEHVEACYGGNGQKNNIRSFRKWGKERLIKS